MPAADQAGRNGSASARHWPWCWRPAHRGSSRRAGHRRAAAGACPHRRRRRRDPPAQALDARLAAACRHRRAARLQRLFQAFESPAGRLTAHRVAVYAYDQRGFGNAPNRRIWPGTTTLVEDARTALALVQARPSGHPGLPARAQHGRGGGLACHHRPRLRPGQHGRPECRRGDRRRRDPGRPGGLGAPPYGGDTARGAVAVRPAGAVVPADRRGHRHQAVGQYRDAAHTRPPTRW